MNQQDIIKKPVMTEKAMLEQEKDCYLFWVEVGATKNQIKSAIKEIFGVKPESVRTMRLSGKKKAVVKLSEGDEISLAKLND